MQQFVRTTNDSDEHARLLAIFADAKVAAKAEASFGADADEADELYDREFARQLDANGVTHEQARRTRMILDGCARASQREIASNVAAREQAQAQAHTAARTMERSRTPDLFEQNALDSIASIPKWHIAFGQDCVTLQGWRPAARFSGKPHGEFFVLRYTKDRNGDQWQWPEAIGNVACTALASHSIKVRDAFIRRALKVSEAASAEEQELRASLRAAADV